jgi:hypothetical protein
MLPCSNKQIVNVSDTNESPDVLLLLLSFLPAGCGMERAGGVLEQAVGPHLI